MGLKFKTTKKHPFGKGIKFKGNHELPQIHWENLGWIKPIKEKVWVIDKFDNWKLVKYEIAEGVNKEYCEIFESKREALKYVREEAHKRFKDITKIRSRNGVILSISNFPPDSCELFVYNIKEKTVKNFHYNVWNGKDGWIVEPVIDQYPKTDKEIIDFAPEKHYNIDYGGLIREVYSKEFYIENSALPTKELAEAFLSLMKLIKFRNAWWSLYNWQPDWNDLSQLKYCITNKEILSYSSIYHPICFKTKEIAKDFYQTFKNDIEKAQELLSE